MAVARVLLSVHVERSCLRTGISFEPAGSTLLGFSVPCISVACFAFFSLEANLLEFI